MRANSELAFLDTISCALGGVIVLFFIFAALKEDGAREAISKPVDIASLRKIPSPFVGAGQQVIPELLSVIGLPENCRLVAKESDKARGFRLSADQGLNIVDWRDIDDTSLSGPVRVIDIYCKEASRWEFKIMLPSDSSLTADCSVEGVNTVTELFFERVSGNLTSISCKVP